MNCDFLESYIDRIVVEKEGKYVKLNFFEDFREIEEYLFIIKKLEDLSEKYNIIVVDINSSGGYMQTLTHLVNVIRKFDFVITCNSSVCLSAGFILWCLGDIRLCYPYSEFMWHRESWGMYNKTGAQKRYANHNEKIYEIFIKDIVSDVLTDEQIKLGEETEVWLLGDEMIGQQIATDATSFDMSIILDNDHKTCIIGNKSIIVKNEDNKYDIYAKLPTSCDLHFKDIIEHILIEKCEDNKEENEKSIDKI